MATFLALTLPAMGVLLILLGLAETMLLWLGRRGILPWLRNRTGRSLSATAFDEYTTIFHGTKRIELEHRQEERMLRDDEQDGAPPRGRITIGDAVVLLPPPEERP